MSAIRTRNRRRFARQLGPHATAKRRQRTADGPDYRRWIIQMSAVSQAFTALLRRRYRVDFPAYLMLEEMREAAALEEAKQAASEAVAGGDPWAPMMASILRLHDDWPAVLEVLRGTELTPAELIGVHFQAPGRLGLSFRLPGGRAYVDREGILDVPRRRPTAAETALSAKEQADGQ